MSETVDVLLNLGNGEITIAFSEFTGDECYLAGKEILAELHGLGVELTIDEIIPQESPIPIVERVNKKVRA